MFVNRATRCAPPFPRWDQSCSRHEDLNTRRGRSQHCLPRRRRAGAAASRPQGLRSMLTRARMMRCAAKTYGNVSAATAAQCSASCWFGKPGRNIFSASRRVDLGSDAHDERWSRIVTFSRRQVYRNPRLYATFLLWILSELFEELPEVGDVDKPKLVFFFDEAHLCSMGAEGMLTKIGKSCVSFAQRVSAFISSRRIRSTCRNSAGATWQSRAARSRAFTPRDQKSVKAAAVPSGRTRPGHGPGDHRARQG